MSAIPVSTMVFTLDEEVNLPQCLASLAWCDDVIVVDSGSGDATRDIATQAGARVFEHEFTGFGDQRNWALEQTGPRHEWVLVLDADERTPPEFVRRLEAVVGAAPDTVAAYRMARRFHLWGKWLRYSSLYPAPVVRLVRAGRVRYVNRGHAETQIAQGDIRDLGADLVDENHKGLEAWFERQNRYTTQDAIYAETAGAAGSGSLWSRDPLERKAALKRLAWRIPLRPLWFFLYSYVWRRGFLDGREGFMFCYMRAVYEATINIKRFDLRRR